MKARNCGNCEYSRKVAPFRHRLRCAWKPDFPVPSWVNTASNLRWADNGKTCKTFKEKSSVDRRKK